MALLSLYHLANFLLVINNAIVNSHGLKLRMIHSHSLESPFLRNNNSHLQRIKMLASQSSIRTNYNSKTSPSTMYADVDVQRFYYIVKIGIGTFKSKQPYKEYYLYMDTGSNLVWLQCEGCTNCFRQTPRPFPKDKSSSFRPILNHNDYVHYHFEYIDGDNTRGILAHETFYLKTKEGGIAKIENIQFGCGLDNKMVYGNYENNKIAGIIGLGWHDKSFVQQLGPKIKGKFSYCLPVIISNEPPSTYLRFGDDIDISHSRNTKSTPLYRRNEQGYYYFKMQGISINNYRLNISQTMFALGNNDSKSNCMIDTGTPYSRIIKPVFQILKQELTRYFSRFKGMRIIDDHDSGLELCYDKSRAEGFENLPTITYHLQGSRADFVLKAESAFEDIFEDFSTRSRNHFCLAMVQVDDDCIVGSYQQTNHRIIIDSKNEQLIFYPEDCSENP